MAITLNSAGADANVGAQTVEMGAPASITDDDILLALLYSQGNLTLTLNETGWVQKVAATHVAGFDHTIAVWWKKAASESGTYTYNVSGGADVQMKGIILAFTGVDTTDPFDVTPTTDISVANSTINTPPDITPVTDSSMIVCWNGAATSIPAGGRTHPTGYTELMDNRSTNYWSGCAIKELVTAALESPGDWSTFNSTTDHVGITLALRPAGAGGGIMPLLHTQRMLRSL